MIFILTIFNNNRFFFLILMQKKSKSTIFIAKFHSRIIINNKFNSRNRKTYISI